MQWFNNLKIVYKLSIGFAIPIGIILLISGVSFSGFTSLRGYFGSYEIISNETIRAMSIERDFVDVRRHVTVFTDSEIAESAVSAQELIVKLQSEIAEMIERTSDPERKELMEQVDRDIDQYSAELDQVIALETELDKKVTGKIDVLGPRIMDAFNVLNDTQYAGTDANFAADAELAMEDYIEVSTQILRYLSEPSEEILKEITAATASLERRLNGLILTTSGTGAFPVIETIQSEFTDYSSTFEVVVSDIDALEHLIRVSMADNATTLGEAVAGIVRDQLNDRNQIEAETLEIVEETSLLSIVTAVLGLLAGLVTAYLLTRALGRPISELTQKMRQIADGDLSADLDTNRTDEIGDMVEAVAVFKQNAVERERLEQQAQAETKEREERARAIESHVKSFESEIAEVMSGLSTASSSLDSTSNALGENAEQTQSQTADAAAASAQASANVETVATATEELTASIQEISGQVSQSSNIAANAMDQAEATSQQASALVEAADRVGEIVELIADIAEQTNLLALNATIEAARAGDAGKGFAVVASEVKSLANQTAKATEDISQQIQAIQTATSGSADAIRGIREIIGQINEISGSIASAVEEQSAATKEIARNVSEAHTGSQTAARHVKDVSVGANETSASAQQVAEASSELASHSKSLEAQVSRFIGAVQAA